MNTLVPTPIRPYVLFSCKVNNGTLICSNAYMYTDPTDGVVTIVIGDSFIFYLLPD